MLFAVVLSRPSSSAATVQYATQDQAAGAGHAVGGASCAAGVDYVTASGTLTFQPGETVKTIPVTVCPDGVVEPDETLLFNLSSPSNATLARQQATGTITQSNPPGTFIISELRTSGPAGLGDDFVELFNNTDSPLTVAASDASGGYGLFKMGATCADSPVLIAQIANGVVIPARGHYLLVGSAYSLSAYAAGDQTLTSDIESDRNVGLFTTSDASNLSTAARLDAVGFGANVDSAPGACDLLREGTNLPASSGSTLEYSYFRDECQGSCVGTGGFPTDTGDNSHDFLFADTAGVSTPMGQRLGAPGPENKTSPINRLSTVGVLLLDGGKAASGVPNRERDPSDNSDPNTKASGTLSIRRRVVNNTGADVTRLRFRVISVTTFPNAAGNADLRAITSGDVDVTNIHDSTTCVDRKMVGGGTATNCTVTVRGTLLEQPPTQAIGGGYNSTWSVDLSGLSGGKLSAGQSVEVQMRMGVVKMGNFRLLVVVEALP